MEFPALRAAFERDGFALVHGVLDTVSIARARAHRAALIARLGLEPTSAIVAAPLEDPDAAALAADPRLLGPATALLGPAARCFGVSYLSKAPHAGLPTRWHQDAGPWAERLAGAAALSIWIALADADEENGCLCVVPGSQLLPTQPLLPDSGEASLFGIGIDESAVDAERAHYLPVSAGDAVILHDNLIHSAGANRSERSREAVSIRYAAR